MPLGTFGNVLWFVLGGSLTGMLWALAGFLWCITIIGIPVGKQCLKISRLCFFPFGKAVTFDSRTSSFLLNLIWIAFTGWSLALEVTLAGIVCCITIVGIPFGKQYFKIVHLALTPFGSEIVNS